MASTPKEPKFNKDGSVSRRGHSDGSKGTRFKIDDGRVRRGRPKGASDDKTDVLAVRDMPVTVNQGPRKKTMSTRRAAYLRVREKMLRGDLKAIDWFDRKMMLYEPPSVEPDLSRDLLAEDKEILARGRARGVLPPIERLAGAESDKMEDEPGDGAYDEPSDGDER